MAPSAPKLDPLFTDNTNAYGPLGNDTGSDVFHHYAKWCASGKRPGEFLPQFLQTWEVGDYDWDDADIRIILDEMQRSRTAVFERLTRDDIIIGLAFAQFVVDGVTQPRVLERALKAVDRQLNPEMIEFRGWDDPKYRQQVLRKVHAFLAAHRPAV